MLIVIKNIFAFASASLYPSNQSFLSNKDKCTFLCHICKQLEDVGARLGIEKLFMESLWLGPCTCKGIKVYLNLNLVQQDGQAAKLKVSHFCFQKFGLKFFLRLLLSARRSLINFWMRRNPVHWGWNGRFAVDNKEISKTILSKFRSSERTVSEGAISNFAAGLSWISNIMHFPHQNLKLEEDLRIVFMEFLWMGPYLQRYLIIFEFKFGLSRWTSC